MMTLAHTVRVGAASPWKLMAAGLRTTAPTVTMKGNYNAIRNL